MVASSRLLFAMGRNRLIYQPVGRVHPRTQTPWVAILVVSAGTVAAMFLGEAGLVPILEVGALSSTVAWLAACASCLRLSPTPKARLAAVFGVLVTLAMVSMKLLPFVPGHFSRYEWIALGLWVGMGLVLRTLARRAAENAKSELQIQTEAS
jgi:amino acid transporter